MITTTDPSVAVEALLRDGVAIVADVVEPAMLESLRVWRDRGFLCFPDRTVFDGRPSPRYLDDANIAKERIAGKALAVINRTAEELDAWLADGMFEVRPPRVYDALSPVTRDLGDDAGWHRDAGEGLRVMMPLDPFTAGIATEFMIGSQLDRVMWTWDQVHQALSPRIRVAAVCEPGAAILFNAQTLHRRGPRASHEHKERRMLMMEWSFIELRDLAGRPLPLVLPPRPG